MKINELFMGSICMSDSLSVLSPSVCQLYVVVHATCFWQKSKKAKMTSYSDLNFILLLPIVKNVSRRSIDCITQCPAQLSFLYIIYRYCSRWFLPVESFFLTVAKCFIVGGCLVGRISMYYCMFFTLQYKVSWGDSWFGLSFYKWH